MKQRRSGVLLHPSSLPGKYGIGTLGAEAMKFVNWLVDAKQSVWQILPLGPTDCDNSPYQCFSAFAGNPILIDLEKLVDQQFLYTDELPAKVDESDRIQFCEIEKPINIALRSAYNRFSARGGFNSGDYKTFWDQNWWWLETYSLFMACMENEPSREWYNWHPDLKHRKESALKGAYFEHRDGVWYHRFLQFVFYQQWFELKRYANNAGVKIFGDIPLYVSMNSADVWANQELFLLDENGNPTHVGGVPPDYFSETGQLWGNPVFNWEKLAEQDYQWWMARLYANLNLFDWVRIDHFRGLESYWSIPAGDETAINGKWEEAHGDALLALLHSQMKEIPIVAEDLGEITPEVRALRKKYKLPGMKVLQFAFLGGPNGEHLPQNYESDFIAYTGTHDNNTSVGWLDNLKGREREFVHGYFDSESPTAWEVIRLAESSVAKTCILPVQDLLGLNGDARMNKPGTVDDNWSWKLKSYQLTHSVGERLARLTVLCNRGV